MGFTLAKRIRGLGIAGAPGLLAVLYPEHFETVDQLVVDALFGVSTWSERLAIHKVHVKLFPSQQGIPGKQAGVWILREGCAAIKVLRRQAGDLN